MKIATLSAVVVLLISGCGGNGGPAAIEHAEVVKQMDAICGDHEDFPRAEDPHSVMDDFNGDGYVDALVGFTCYTETDRLPGGYVYFWSSAEWPKARQVLGDDGARQGQAPWWITSVTGDSTSVAVEYENGEGIIVANLMWTPGGFVESARALPRDTISEPPDPLGYPDWWAQSMRNQLDPARDCSVYVGRSEEGKAEVISNYALGEEMASSAYSAGQKVETDTERQQWRDWYRYWFETNCG